MVHVIGLILMALIFMVDFELPLGVAGAVPYVAVILISLWMRDYRYVIFFATACSILTVLGFYLSPGGGELWKVIVNRALALFVIWVTAILVIKWESSHRKLVQSEHESEKEQEKKQIYVATIHGAQHITNNLLNQLKLVGLEIENHPDFDKETSTLFYDMLADAENLMNKLSSVKEIDADTISRSVQPKTNIPISD